MKLWCRAAWCALVLELCALPVAAAPPTGKPAPAKLYTALKAPSTKVRLKAVELLARSGDPAAPAALVPLLADKDPVMRASVCDAFAQMRMRSMVGSIQPLLTDDNELVVKRATNAMALLMVPVAVRPLDDKAEHAQLNPLLKTMTTEGLAKHPFVELKTLPPGTPGYTVMLVVQSVNVRTEGNTSIVEVVNSATVAELPANALRFSTRITAGAAVDGPLTPALEKELAEDAVRSAAPALADELSAWFAAVQ